LMLDNPTLVKRPVCEKDGAVTVGFTAQVQDILAG
jgi:arsenate reductase-like glutaredoxin family protein